MRETEGRGGKMREVSQCMRLCLLTPAIAMKNETMSTSKAYTHEYIGENWWAVTIGTESLC